MQHNSMQQSNSVTC